MPDAPMRAGPAALPAVPHYYGDPDFWLRVGRALRTPPYCPAYRVLLLDRYEKPDGLLREDHFRRLRCRLRLWLSVHVPELDDAPRSPTGDVPVAAPQPLSIASDLLLRRAAGVRPVAGGLAAAVGTFVALNLVAVSLQPWLMWVASHDKQYTVAHLVDYTRAPRPDIIFMGSSPVLSGLDPATAAKVLATSTGVPVRALNLRVTDSDIAMPARLPPSSSTACRTTSSTPRARG